MIIKKRGPAGPRFCLTSIFLEIVYYMNMSEKSDQQLVVSYLKGDEKSLEVLIKRYLRQIYNFVYKYTKDASEAGDITQEVFVKIWRNIRKFDQRKSFKNWIFSIAKNTSLDFLKKKKPIPFSRFENEKGQNFFAEALVDPSPLPLETVENKSDIDLVKSALNKLFPQHRAILFLRYSNNLTFRQIAAYLGEPLNTVKSRCRRAIAVLKRQF